MNDVIADMIAPPLWALIGLAGLVVVPVLTFVIGLLLVWKDSIVAGRKARRGFEVKSITGKTPVLQKKEVDHG